MKKLFILLILISLSNKKLDAQTFSPIPLSGYNFDAVAEATTALANTTGALDGSNYVLYSVSYGTVYSVSTGLPNNGLISSGTNTYQLGTYSLNNMCFTPVGTTDSLTFVTPAPYSGVSILCFSTEGNGSMNVTIRFTDNTTQIFNNQNLTDWFGTGTAVISGFDRVNRSGTTPANTSGNPKMFALDLSISCANRVKLIKNIKFQNISSVNPRNCIMAISGAAMPAYTVNTSPVTCSGGSNGSATISVQGGIQPYTYTWSTTPLQTGALVGTLSTGAYSVISQDAGLCPVTTTFAITQSLVPQPSLAVTANSVMVCAGSTIIINTSGANTYTWNTNANTNSISVIPSTSGVYSVGGLTAFNCYRTGSINITVNQLPVISFTTPANICVNAPQVQLSASPTGGSYGGTGILVSSFYPNFAGVGTKTVSYTYVDNNFCTGIAVNTIIVNALPIVTFTLSPNSLCANSSTLSLSGSPNGGTFSGTGITGSVYTPSVPGVGTQTVIYTYTDANNCTAAVTSSVIINPVPTVTFQTTKKLYCIFNPTIYLNAQPSGGVFSGQGTSASGIFSPTLAGVGSHTLIYTYTDVYGCVGKALFSATVSACSGLADDKLNAQAFAVYPNPNTGTFTVKANSDLNLVLINDLGQTIRFLKLNMDNKNELIIDSLPDGIYFIAGQIDSQFVKQKIIVLK